MNNGRILSSPFLDLLFHGLRFLWYNVVIGVLAQLIRALRWQRRGQEFESPILHQIVFKTHRYGEFFYFHCGYLAFTLFFLCDPLKTNNFEKR